MEGTLQTVVQKTKKDGDAYFVVTIDGTTGSAFDDPQVQQIPIGSKVTADLTEKGNYKNWKNIKQAFALNPGVQPDVTCSPEPPPMREVPEGVLGTPSTYNPPKSDPTRVSIEAQVVLKAANEACIAMLPAGPCDAAHRAMFLENLPLVAAGLADTLKKIKETL